MMHSLTQAAGGEGDGYYESDSEKAAMSDNEGGVSSSDTESETESMPKKSKANKSAAAAIEKAAAPVTLPKKLAFDAGVSAAAVAAAAPAGSTIQMAEVMAMALRNFSGAPASFNVTVSGQKRKTFNLVFANNLEELEAKNVEPKFVPEIGDIGKFLGGEVLPVTKIAIIGYDFSAVPASLGVIAPAHFKEAQHDHLSSAGPVLFTGDKLSKKEFEHEMVVYQGVESEFKKHVAKEFPGVTEKNIFDNVRESTKAGMYLVPTESIVAAAVHDEIEHQKEECTAAGKEYNGPELSAMRINELDLYHMPKPLVNVAVNCLIKSFQETNDSFNIKEKLYFTFARTALSPSTIQKQKSSNAQIWTDPRELSQFAKNGATLETVTKANFVASLTVAVYYNSPEKK